MKVALTNGAYSAKSLVAEAQRSINLYGEKNPQDSPFPFTYYLSPGLTVLATAEPPIMEAGWRGMWMASNGSAYGVCGSTVYAISSNWALTTLGAISTTSGKVSITDNGTSLVLVDGSATGYQVQLSNNAFTSLGSAQSFMGGNTIDFVDGFLVLNVPNENQWYSSLVNEVSFNADYFASKDGFSDTLVGLMVAKRYIYLFGKSTTEVWYDFGPQGVSPFPFGRMPGIFMQYGLAAVGSLAQMDGDIYWLAQSPQGNAFICRSQSFNAQHISTFAIDNELASYGTLDDAIGWTYELDGHFFYVITFPTADATWQYDMSTGQWNELVWIDDNGDFHRHRANCYASLYGQPVVGDWENGNLYLWDVNNYTDNGQPIVRIRSFAHSVDDNSARLRYREFIANMEVGDGGGGIPVPVFLRWSDTRGRSWGNAIESTLGMEGDYLRSIQFQRLGMARDRVFELSWSAPCKTALLGAWVEAQSNNQ
jgi:hypothetical protein